MCTPSSERCRLYAVGRASRPSAAPIPPPMTTWWWVGHRRPAPKRRSGPRLVSPGARHARGGAGQAPTPPTSWRRGPSRRLLHPGAIPASHQAETYRATAADRLPVVPAAPSLRSRSACGFRRPRGPTTTCLDRLPEGPARHLWRHELRLTIQTSSSLARQHFSDFLSD